MKLLEMMGHYMLNNKFLITGLTALSITLTACGGGKTTMFRVDPSHTAVFAESGPTSLDTLDRKSVV